MSRGFRLACALAAVAISAVIAGTIAVLIPTPPKQEQLSYFKVYAKPVELPMSIPQSGKSN